MAKINALPTLNNLPQGVRKIDIGDAKWQAEMVANFATAVMSGVLLVFAVLVLLYKRILPPFVNMGSLMLAPLGGALALHVAGQPISMPVLIGLLMLQIGRAHVCTPVTNAHLVCRLLLEKNNNI